MMFSLLKVVPVDPRILSREAQKLSVLVTELRMTVRAEPRSQTAFGESS
jgi:hypothetical protein